MRITKIVLCLLLVSLGGCGESRPTGTGLLPEESPALVQAVLEITDDRLSLRAPQGTVQIRRAPFGLEFSDVTGARVLRSAATPVSDFAIRPLNPQRLPGGAGAAEGPPLYAPVSFLVGAAAQLSFPATFWVGNLLASSNSGVEYRLDSVQEPIERLANGVRFAATTTDPGGRMALVTVTADTVGSFKVSVQLSPVNQAVASITAAFESSPGEAFHGFGGRRNKINQRGEQFLNWAEEFHLTPEAFQFPLLGPVAGENYQFPTGAQGAYYVQSLFVSPARYGFLLERDALSSWRMASDRDDAWSVEVAGAELDFVVAPGDAPRAIESLTRITGRHRVPAPWQLGPMLSEAVQTSSEGIEAYDAKVQESLRMMRELQLPVTAFIFEGWAGLQRIGTYQQVVDDLTALGIRPLTYFRAFLGQADDALEEAEAYEEAMANGYVVHNALGLPYLFGSPLGTSGIAALIDFTHPEAVTWWKGRIKRALAQGSQGFMQDFGEQTFADMVFHDGSTGIEMHNRYAVLYHRATREAFDEYRAENPASTVEPWFFVRNGYTGRPGSAAFESASWSGDNTADWSRASGLGAVIPDLLNRSIGGAYGFVTEIGGFIDVAGRPSKELLIRWTHHASLMPVHRLHGGPVNGTHMPWRYDDETVAEYRRSALRHIAAQPLILRLWREAEASGMPIVRPLWLAYPDDPQATRQDQQFLLGPDVLVAPVVEPGATNRAVYFPAGCWQHPEQGSRHTGPSTETVPAALGELPYFFRCGTTPFTVPAELRKGQV